MSRIYPGTSQDYILTKNPSSGHELVDFLQLIKAEARIVISFGDSSLSLLQPETSDPFTWDEKHTVNCLLSQYKFIDPNMPSPKTIYHLIFDGKP